MKPDPYLLISIIAAALLLVCTGCSGINASKSVSPLDFLLPGLHIQNTPRMPVLPAETNMLVCFVTT